jgi:hypothetical protein
MRDKTPGNTYIFIRKKQIRKYQEIPKKNPGNTLKYQEIPVNVRKY